MGSDEPAVGTSEVRKPEEWVRELERLLSRKTMENEILREALLKAQAKEVDFTASVAAERWFPMKCVAEALGVWRSSIAERTGARRWHRRPRRARHECWKWRRNGSVR